MQEVVPWRERFHDGRELRATAALYLHELGALYHAPCMPECTLDARAHDCKARLPLKVAPQEKGRARKKELSKCGAAVASGERMRRKKKESGTAS